MKQFLLQFAQKIDAGASGIPQGDGQSLLANGLNLVYFLAGSIAVIMVIVAGVMYVTSTGDSGRVTKAKNMLTFAVVGIIIVLIAFAITNWVIGVLK